MGYYKNLSIDSDFLEKERIRLRNTVTDNEAVAEILLNFEASAYQIILDAINHRLDNQLISSTYHKAIDSYVEELLKEMNLK